APGARAPRGSRRTPAHLQHHAAAARHDRRMGARVCGTLAGGAGRAGAVRRAAARRERTRTTGRRRARGAHHGARSGVEQGGPGITIVSSPEPFTATEATDRLVSAAP